MVCQVQLSQAESRANAFEFESKIEALNHQLDERERLRAEAEEGRSKAEIKRVATEALLSSVRRDLSEAKNAITQLQARLEQYEKQMEEMQHRLRISEEAVVQEHQHASVVSKVKRHMVRTSSPPQRSSPPPVELEIRVKQQTPAMSLDADFTSSPSVGTWPKSSRPSGVFSDYSPFVADASAATEQMSLARLKECLRELAENLHQTQSTLQESERERVELLRQVDRKDQQIQELLAESFRNNLHLSNPHASRSQTSHTHTHTHTLSPFPLVAQMPPPADFTQHTSQNIGDPITPRKLEIQNTSPQRDFLKNALQTHRNQQYTCMEERDDFYTSLEDGDLSKESTFSASSVQSLPGPALVAVPAHSSASMLSTPSWTDLPCLYSCSMGSARIPPSKLYLDVEGCIGPDNDNTSVSALSKQSTLASLTPTPTSDGGYFHGNFEGGHTQGVLTAPGKKDW